jgi:hypothetical protein
MEGACVTALCALSAKHGETMGERGEGQAVLEECDNSGTLLDTVKSLVMRPL